MSQPCTEACNHTHGEDGECNHQHGHEEKAQQQAHQEEESKGDDDNAAPAHSHSNKSQPCDYCSSIVAHARAHKLAASRAGVSVGVDEADEEESEEEEEEDEQDKLVLPAQRILVPLMGPTARRVVLAVFTFVTLKVLRNIWIAKRSGGVA